MGSRPQFEIQLGHLCNNRCVFCVSGQLTHKGEAPFLSEGALTEQITAAFAAGHRRITLLGGEPTIQPYFMSLVRHAVATGFEQIVIFSNGSKPGRTDLIDEVVATGGHFEWRFSFQGGTREAHERTTRRKGSFDQLVKSLTRVRALGQRATVNMCIVSPNAESVGDLPALLGPFGISQIHVDMLNPYDTGVLTPTELAEIMPRYATLRAPLAKMVAGFGTEVDVNIGNLPYCIAPDLAPWIHHGGETTFTVTADDFGRDRLQPLRNKYQVKLDRKVKPERCRDCAFDLQCSGVFSAYADQYGLDEFQPVAASRLVELDLRRSTLGARLAPLFTAALGTQALPSPWREATVRSPTLDEVQLVFAGGENDGNRLEIVLRAEANGLARFQRFGLDARVAEGDATALSAASDWVWQILLRAGEEPVFPPAMDVFEPVTARVAEAMRRFRAGAPFGSLRWVRTVTNPALTGVELTLEARDGECASVWVLDRDGEVSSGYRVADSASAKESTELRAGLVAVLTSLRARSGSVVRRPAAGMADAGEDVVSR